MFTPSPMSVARTAFHIPAGKMPVRTENHGSAGYTFPLMLVILAALAFGAGQLELTQSYRLKRDKEEELLFRGLEYLKAIRAFQAAGATEKRYPRNLSELVSDPRSQGPRFIRQLYKDPITARDFDPILTKEGTISGVVSSSKDIPFRKTDFDKELQGFDKAEDYSGWRFDAKTPAPQAAPGQPQVQPPSTSPDQPQVQQPITPHYR